MAGGRSVTLLRTNFAARFRRRDGARGLGTGESRALRAFSRWRAAEKHFALANRRAHRGALAATQSENHNGLGGKISPVRRARWNVVEHHQGPGRFVRSVARSAANGWRQIPMNRFLMYPADGARLVSGRQIVKFVASCDLSEQFLSPPDDLLRCKK